MFRGQVDLDTYIVAAALGSNIRHLPDPY